MRLDSFDLNLLILLDMLLEEQNVSRAAMRLNLTQPAVSNALARLRLHFNDPLLRRVGAQLHATPLALQLRPQLSNILAQARGVVQARGGFDPLTTRAKLCIGCSDWFAATHLTRLLRRLPDLAPGLQIDHQRISPTVSNAMLEGRVDLLVMRAERLLADHPSRLLVTDPVAVIGCAKQAPFGPEGASLQDLLAWPQIMAVAADGMPIMPQLHRALSREHITVVTGSSSLLPHMVIGTHYIAFVPASAARDYGAMFPIRGAPVHDAAPSVMHLQWHRSRTDDPMLTWVCDQLRNIQDEIRG